MATKVQAPQLTPNNRIYLYQLLSRELGCGKQVFMPAVETALASDRMTADDLGFESTRALLEALEEFVKLTIFKGGRIYATVMPQPSWDEALAALESGKAKASGGPSNKPWKRKKTDKALKPVRPKRVKRPEPAPKSEPIEEGSGTSPATHDEAARTRIQETDMAAETAGAGTVNDLEGEPQTAEVAETSPMREAMSRVESDDALAHADGGPRPSPAISLTVTYNPYSGIDREMKLESHPVSPKPEQRAGSHLVSPKPEQRAESHPVSPKPEQRAEPQTEPYPASTVQGPAVEQGGALAEHDQSATAARSTEVSTSAPLASEILATYPADFSTEVYLTSGRIADLCELLPYGTDVFTLLAEDYARARALKLINGTRACLIFPLRIQRVDSIEPIRVILKRRGGTGLRWELSAIE